MANSIQIPSVIIDNADVSGATTPLEFTGSHDLTLGPGARVLSTALNGHTVNINNLWISSNSWLTYTNQLLTLSFGGNAWIQKGGSINLEGKGHTPFSSILGASGGSGAGAGHGGFGGGFGAHREGSR
ncbi:MAG: hypothetical protein ACK4UN_06555 [Limisphaerales bacterium]